MGIRGPASPYLFVVLHLQPLQLAALRALSLTLVLGLVELGDKTNKPQGQSLPGCMFCKTGFEGSHKSVTSVRVAHLIGQIGHLTLQSFHLPPQVFLFLVHPLSVAPLFPEVLLEDLYLRQNEF